MWWFSAICHLLVSQCNWKLFGVVSPVEVAVHSAFMFYLLVTKHLWNGFSNTGCDCWREEILQVKHPFIYWHLLGTFTIHSHSYMWLNALFFASVQENLSETMMVALCMCRASVFFVFGGRQISVGVFICGVSGPCSSPNSKQNGIGSSCSLFYSPFSLVS